MQVDRQKELAGVDVRAVLERLNGDTELLSKLLRQFAAELPPRVHVICRLASGGQLDKLRREARCLAGSAGSLSANEVRATAHALEDKAALEDPAKLRAALGRLLVASARLAQSVARLSKT